MKKLDEFIQIIKMVIWNFGSDKARFIVGILSLLRALIKFARGAK